MQATIFATAYDEFALRAFDVHAVDYLLKPFTRQRFDQAFDRALQRISGDRENISRLLASLPGAFAHLERIVVREGERLFFVAADDVFHLSAEGNYVGAHGDGSQPDSNCTLSDLMLLFRSASCGSSLRDRDIDAIRSARALPREPGGVKSPKASATHRRYRARLLANK